MSEVKIIEKKDEPILKRKAVVFEVSHGASGTPKRKETKSKLATLLSADEGLVVIDGFVTSYGLNRTRGRAFVYASEDAMKVAEGAAKVGKEKEGKYKKPAPGTVPGAAPAAK